MKDVLHFEPLTLSKYETYIEVGSNAYNQHYLHLWPNNNSKPYIESSFTHEVLIKEQKDSNTVLYLIHLNSIAVGIFKITLDCKIDSFEAKEALYIDKIYILNEFSGHGIGKKVLQFVQLRATAMDKKIIWLDTMQKGPALAFYLKNGFKIHSESQVIFNTVIREERFMWIMIYELNA